MLNFKTPIAEVPNIGPSLAKKLKKLEILTLKDLLYYFPLRYDDFRKISSIAQIKTTGSGVIKGKIIAIKNKRSPQKRMLITEAIISDQTDSLKVVWFNQPFLTKIIKPGETLYLAGKIEHNEDYGLELLNPSYEIYRGKSPLHFGRLVPVYPLTSGLSQKQLRFLIKNTLAKTKIKDWLAQKIKDRYNLTPLPFALEQIHFPKNQTAQKSALERLKFDELFFIQLRNETFKEKIKKQKAYKIEFKLKETKKFVEGLPFKLTEDQRKTSWQILKDLEKEKPMNRLLEGEVGSGKTLVAALAILNTALNNFQTAYLAPTEILAVQQFKNISRFLKSYKFKIALLTRSNFKIGQKKSSKKEILKKIAEGKIDLVIGTHTLIQEEVSPVKSPAEGEGARKSQFNRVKFKKLALLIVDEQHRFGVVQRQVLLSQQKISPHFLSMTATPIPRSLALILYGDLDLSVIKEKPAGRKEIKTQIVKLEGQKEVYEFLREEIKKGRQGYVICPLIDPSDKLGSKSVKEETEKITKIFPEFKIACLHGRLKAEEKNKIMADFSKNKIKILIATTVVEVGIDVPNASLMIIENAERFGLAQLYQLRGRIGRSSYESFCFLMLGEKSKNAFLRLQALLEAKNSLELAEKDLSLRGPGEIYGLEQSGFLRNFKLTSFRDTELIKKTKEAASLFLHCPEFAERPFFQDKIKSFEDKIISLE